MDVKHVLQLKWIIQSKDNKLEVGNPMEDDNHTATAEEGGSKKPLSVSDKVAAMAEIRRTIDNTASKNIKVSQGRQKKYFDERHSPEVCCVKPFDALVILTLMSFMFRHMR